MYKTSLMFGLACSFVLIILAGCRLGDLETQPTATPTLVIIDPKGAIYGFDNGANVYGTFKPIIRLLIGPSNE